jgi:hypothetical protein
MNSRILAVGLVVAGFVSGAHVEAGVTSFAFNGSGVSGSGHITFETDSVVGDPVGAYTITGISGTFSDANLGLVDEAITGLVAISPVDPPYGAPFPVSLSLLDVLNSPSPDPAISYDNLFYPGSSPITCPDYPGSGGHLDVYGVMFTLANGYIVDVWSNGTIPGVPAPLSYGAAVVDRSMSVVDYQSGGVTFAVPEPASLCLVATGLLGALGWRRRSAASRSIVN